MKTAVVMCTYNGSPFLYEQMNSILSQTLLPDKIYIYDDNSTDNTRVLLQNYQKNFPDLIELLGDNTHRGINRAIQFVLSKTKEDAIFISDQDDIWVPDKIEKMLQVAKQQTDWDEIPFIVHSESCILSEGKRNILLSNLIGQRNCKIETEDLFCHNLIQGCTMLINRQLILMINNTMDIYIPHCVYDHWMALVAAEFGKIYFVAAPLVYYRIHTSNAVGSVQLNPYEKYALSRNRKLACEFMYFYNPRMTLSRKKQILFWIDKGYRKISFHNFTKLLIKGGFSLCIGIKNI